MNITGINIFNGIIEEESPFQRNLMYSRVNKMHMQVIQM